jgi:large repetitive protein
MRKLISILIFLIPFDHLNDIFPGTGGNNAGIGATAWSTPTNILANDNNVATCNAAASSQYLVASNFSFTVPATATIKGITVKIAATESSSGTETLNAQLQNESGTLVGSSKTVSLSGTGETVYTYGSTSDLWGATLTPAILNDADFGVRFWFTTAHNVTVDYVTVSVEYSIGTTNFFQFF